VLPSTCCSRFNTDGFNLNTARLPTGLEGVTKELMQEKRSTLHDYSLGLHHCFYHFSAGIYNIFSFVSVKHIVTPS